MGKSKRDLYTLQDFQKFIEDNKISSPKDFRERFKTEYNWAMRSGYLKAGNRELTFPGWLDTSKLKTVEDFRKFVKDNDVKNVADMLKRFSAVDKMMRVRGIKSSEIGYPDLIEYNPDLENYTQDYIQQYIIDNKIIHLDDIRKTNMSMYAKIQRMGWERVLEFPLRKEPNPALKKYNTLEDFQNLVDSSNIQCPRDFDKKYPDIYSRLCHLKLTSQIRYSGRIQKRLDSSVVNSINTVDEFQIFIQDNGISSPREFQERFYGLYRKSLTLPQTLDYDNYKMSYPERLTKDILDELNIRVVCQKTFQWLNNSRLRLDFYCEELNLAIEVQGEQHFVPIEFFGGENTYRSQVDRDIKKFNLCIENGVDILYVYYPDLSSSPILRDLALDQISNYFSIVILGETEFRNYIIERNKNREDN